MIFPKVKSPPSPAPTEPGDIGTHLLLLSSQDRRYESGILEGILVSCNCLKNSTPEEPELPDEPASPVAPSKFTCHDEYVPLP